MDLQSLEGRAPTVDDAPLQLIAGGRDGKVDRPIDQADRSAARTAGAFGDDIQQALCNDGTRFLGAAARPHLLFTIDIGFDGAPFRCKFSDNGF
jgi:hypothetical protein